MDRCSDLREAGHLHPRRQGGPINVIDTTPPYPPVLVRADEAEHLERIGHVLLADSCDTDGALTSHRVALGRGADGAVPHRHDGPSELF